MKPKGAYYSGPVSDHFDGTRFFNPNKPHPHHAFSILKWKLTAGKRGKWRGFSANEFDDIPPQKVEGKQLRVSFVGHVTTLIQTQGLNILTDPVWSKRASPSQRFGPARVNPPGIKFENLPKIDIVLLSHNHYDHMDLPTLKKLWDHHRPLILTPLGNDTIIKQTFPEIEAKAYDWGESVVINKDIEIFLEPMHHWSARGIRDKNMALWGAFIIKTTAGNIYFVGDTGFGGGDYFKDAIAKYGSFRLALLPIGAYKPRWFMEYNHMNPDEAVQAYKILGEPYTIPTHYGTFRLADDAQNDPINDFHQAVVKHDIDLNRFRPLKIGESWLVPLVIG